MSPHPMTKIQDSVRFPFLDFYAIIILVRYLIDKLEFMGAILYEKVYCNNSNIFVVVCKKKKKMAQNITAGKKTI